MTPTMIREAKSWLSDLLFADVDEEDIEEMSDLEIVQGVARHYDGGIEQFIKNNENAIGKTV
jgi:hypothetical protein